MTEKRIYVVCQNDFPSAAFDHKPRADAFVERRRAQEPPLQKRSFWHLQDIPFNEGEGDDE